MATKKQTIVEPVEEIVSTEPAAPKMEFSLDNSLTVHSEAAQKLYNGPTVPVFIPALEGSGDNGLKVDQYEHVTIANEAGEVCWKILRGETVEVPVPVFIVLKERYPKI